MSLAAGGYNTAWEAVCMKSNADFIELMALTASFEEACMKIAHIWGEGTMLNDPKVISSADLRKGQQNPCRVKFY